MPLPKDPIKAEETRRKMSEAAKKRMADPDYRQRMSDVHTGKKQSRETIAKRVAANTGQRRTPPKNCQVCGKIFYPHGKRNNTAKFCSMACKGKWQSENAIGEKGAHWQGGDVIKKCEECGKEFSFGKTRMETARFCSFACKGVWMSKNLIGENNPSYGKSLPHSEEWKKEMSERVRGEGNPRWRGGSLTKICEVCGNGFIVDRAREKSAKYCSSKCRAIWMSKNLVGENNPSWTGGPKDYCEKWNTDFRRRIRAFFDNTCVECSTPKNEKDLHCHHVYYDKKACCSVNENGKYLSNLGIKDNPYSFEIDGDPNKFILLCDSCHAKSSGKKKREFWARHFEEIINQYYLGRSYFTKEEYEKLDSHFRMV